MTAIDPSVSGGIGEIVLGRRLLGRSEPIAACGVSIHDFQTEQRMQTAMALLRTSKLSIAQIAERSRFSEPTNFTAAFKKHFAVLPRYVRESRAP